MEMDCCFLAFFMLMMRELMRIDRQSWQKYTEREKKPQKHQTTICSCPTYEWVTPYETTFSFQSSKKIGTLQIKSHIAPKSPDRLEKSKEYGLASIAKGLYFLG